MKKILSTTAIILSAVLFSYAQDNTKGFYKDIFMDSGIMLTSRTDLPVTEVLNLTMEAFVSSKHSYTEKYKFTAMDTVRQHDLIVGSAIDENGILLYPDGQPRFRMVYMNGGRAGGHGKSLGEEGRQALRNYVNAGGSYLGSCAGAFVASLGSRKQDGTIVQAHNYIGLWPGNTSSTGLEKSYTAVDIVKKGALSDYYDYGGKTHIDSVRHNGGCFAYMETAPEGTEILATYSTKGRELKRDIDGLPCVWAYKASGSTGRVILCGSHPEGAPDADNIALMSAMVRYAMAGTAAPLLKGTLENGVPREMKATTSENDPEHTRIGDRQYHHFRIDVPKGTSRMTIELQDVLGYKDFDLYLFAARNNFAYSDTATWCYVGEGASKKLEISEPKAGTYYISVFCATTVTSTMGRYGVEYSGRTDVLNGVPYVISASFE